MSALDGKVAVVTGGAQGIGESYVERLHTLGATVVIADLNVASAQAVADRLNAAGASSKVAALQVDVTDTASAAALRDEVVGAFGGVDILVNNAAYYAGFTRADVADLDDSEWDKMMAVNVTGVFKMCRAFLPALSERQGVIVNQSSSGAFVAAPGSTHYCVSKAAVVAFTRSLAAEVGPAGVRVNAIAPGYTLTEATKQNFGERSEASSNAAALRRAGEPEDLCGVLEFLATDQSAWMTGQTVVVDGGRVFPQ